MAVEHRASSAAEGPNDAEITIPASTQVGDLMLIFTNNKNTTGYLDIDGLGWTYGESIRLGMSAQVIWKIAEAGDAGSTLLIKQESTTANQVAVCEVFYGFDPTNPISEIESKDQTSPDPTTPSATAFAPGLLIVSGCHESSINALEVGPTETELTELTRYSNPGTRTTNMLTATWPVPAGSTGTRLLRNQGLNVRIKMFSLVIHEAQAPNAGFPVVKSKQFTRYSSAETTTLTVALPSDIQADDGLLLFYNTSLTTVLTDLQGFTYLFDVGGSRSNVYCAYKKATGNEGSSVTFELDRGVTTACAVVYLIDGGTIVDWDTNPPEAAAESRTITGNSGDPLTIPTLTPSWGLDKNLWLAVVGQYKMYLVATAVASPKGIPWSSFDSLETSSSIDPRLWASVLLEEAIEQKNDDWDIVVPSDDEWTSGNSTVAIRGGIPISEFTGLFDLDAAATLDFDGTYEPALFTGQFALTGEAAVDPDGFFFEDQEGDLNLAGVAALTMTGETEPPVYNSWFDLTGEAALDFDGVAEVYGDVALGAEATIGFLGSYIPVGGGAAVMHGAADITFTGEFTIPDTEGDVALGAEATISFVGQHTAPVFTGQFILGAVASLSAEGEFLSEAFGEFSLSVEADFGIWAQVPLQPGTGSSVKGDRATPTRVWSLEDPATVEGEDDPTRVKGRQ